MMLSEFQVKNCKMADLLRYCKWLLSHGKFDDDYLSLTRKAIIDRLQLYGYVDSRPGRWNTYG